MVARSLVAAWLVLAAAGFARADDAPLVPRECLDKAATGDWEVLAVEVRVVQSGERHRQRAALGFRVSATSDAAVTIEADPRPAPPVPTKPRLLSRASAKLEELLGLSGKTFESVTVCDEKRTACGRGLACRKLSFTTRQRIDLEKQEPLVFVESWSVWLSPELPSPGLVAFAVEQHASGGASADEDVHQEALVAGYGHGDLVGWGKKIDALATGDEKLPPPPATPLPLNVAADAKEGDWETVVFRTKTTGPAGRIESGVSTWTVSKVTEDEVAFDIEQRSPEGVVSTHKGVLDRHSPTLEEFLGFHSGQLLEIASRDDKRELDGRTFEGKRVDCDVDRRMPFGRTDPGRPQKHGRMTGHETLLLSPEVKGRGLVAVVVDLHLSGGAPVDVHSELRLVGFGEKDKVLWGKRAAEVVLPKDE